MTGLVVVQCLGILSSLISIIYIVYHRQYRQTAHLAYLNLAVCDFNYAISGILETYVMAYVRRKMLEQDLNSTVSSLSEVDIPHNLLNQVCLAYILFSQFSNLWGILTLTFDRIVAVLQPTTYILPIHFKRTVGFLTTCLLASLIMGIIGGLCIPLSLLSLNINQRHVLTIIAGCIFCIAPSIFNVISYLVIVLYFINLRHQRRRRKITLYITIIKAVLTTTIFTISWLPWLLRVVVLDNLKDGTHKDISFTIIFLYLNTITDPVLYMVPNSVFRKCLTNMMQNSKLWSYRSEKNKVSNSCNQIKDNAF